MSLTFKLEPDGDQWHAYCPQLPGCHTFGDTKKEALANLKEAVLLYLMDKVKIKTQVPPKQTSIMPKK